MPRPFHPPDDHERDDRRWLVVVTGILVISAAVASSVTASVPNGAGASGKALVRPESIRAGSGQTPTDVRHDPELEPVRLPSIARRLTSGSFDDGRSRVSVTAGSRRIDYRIAAVSVLPGERVSVRLRGSHAGEAGVLRFRSGRARAQGPGRWIWTAPDRPGVGVLRVEVPAAEDSVTLNVFVLHPRNRVRDGILNGYRIGTYPERRLRDDPAYEPPRGFIELPAENEDLAVSPHFTLGQFACKQPGEPRYLALSGPLIDKLERILEEVNRSHGPTGTLHVMSGYRTPYYNRAIGNRTTYSRHLWGDAADVWVDADGDGLMDDWNGDGRSTVDDVRPLVELVEAVVARSGGRVRVGGLAAYRRNPVHGPFVHVDARGFRARW